MDHADVCVLLPTYNEAETIGDVVVSYREHGFTDILVVDGDSTDGTRRVAAEHGAEVIIQSGTGKGQAIREAVETIDAEYVLMADGDGTYRAEDAETMLGPLDDGYEHVIGDRFADMHSGAMTRLNQTGNHIINWAFGLIHRQNLHDILSGYRAFTRASFERMTLTADGFGIETEMAVECVKRDIPTAVVPVSYLPRPYGSSTNLHPLRDGSVIFLELYRRAKTNNPLFYFGSVGIVAAIVGVLLGVYVGYEWFVAVPRQSHDVLAFLGAGSIIFGVQLLIFGVLSDMIITLHREQLQRIDELADRWGDGPRSRGTGQSHLDHNRRYYGGDGGVVATDGEQARESRPVRGADSDGAGSPDSER